MKKLKAFATKHPIAFCLAALLSWMIAGGVIAATSAALLQVSMLEFWPQKIGTLGATLLFLVLAWRMTWLESIGITKVGSRQVWLFTALALLYLFPASLYAFFGEATFDFSIYRFSAVAREALMGHIIVGIVEETIFRGILLFALIRVWGHTRRGVMAAVLIQALLFSAPHILQIAVGGSLSATLVVMLISFISGVWYAAIVLRWGSLWSVILIHAITNNIFLVKGLSTATVQPEILAYTRAALAELPLMMIGLWLLMKTPLREHVQTAKSEAFIP